MIVDWAVVASIAAAAAALVSAIGLIITLRHFTKSNQIRRDEDVAWARHEAVAKAIDVTESAAPRSQLPAALWRWSDPRLDYAFLSFRLAHALEGQEQVVSVWALRQTQLMQLAISRSASLKIGIELTAKLLAWDKGQVATDWFAGQVDLDPIAPGFKVPLRRKLTQVAVETVDTGKHLLVALSVLEMFRRILRDLRGL